MALAGAITHKIATEGTEQFKQGATDKVYTLEILNTIEKVKQNLQQNMRNILIETINLNIK